MIRRPLARVLMRAPLAALVILILGACGSASGVPSGAGGDLLCRAHGPARAGVLVIHGGAFVFRTKRSDLRRLCQPFARAGFDALAVDYPLRDVNGALEHTRMSLVRLGKLEGGRPILAYGESAGGTLAAWLGVRHQIDAVAEVAGPSDLLTWGSAFYWTTIMRLGRRDRRHDSPALVVRRPSPLLIMHSKDDDVVPFAQSTLLQRHVPGSELDVLHGLHMKDRHAVPRAIRWLEQQARRCARRQTRPDAPRCPEN